MLALVVSLMMTGFDPSVLTVPIINISENEQLTSALELTNKDLIHIAQSAAKKYHLNAEKFLKTLECEVKKRADGTWDYTAQSDHINRRGVRENSWGMFQIHLDSHPTVTKEQAQDPYFAAEWSATEWAKGNAGMWTCYNINSSNGSI